MPNWAIYNTSNNRVKKWLVSDPNDPTYPVGAGEEAIKDPNVSALAGIALRYWKHSGGSIVEMTQGEKDTVDAEIVAAALAAAKTGAKNSIDGNGGYDLRAMAKIMIDEINTLRQWLASFKVEVAAATTLADLKTRVAGLPGTADRTLVQAKTAYKNLIDGSSLDE